jgi:hypothetical protein
MLAQLLMGFLVDLVFDSAASVGRSYPAEVGKYLEQRGFRPERRSRRLTAS